MRTLGGRYQLVQRIGVGGMSEVWRGHDRVLDRAVAVKIMAPAVEGTLGAVNGVDLVRTEARSAARLAHPNVAGVHDFGTSPTAGRDVPYIVMELVDGLTLSAHLDAGLFDWRIAVRVCAEVAAALERLSGGQYQSAKAEALAGSKEALARLEAGEDAARIAAGWAADEARWRLRRAPYLLYP